MTKSDFALQLDDPSALGMPIPIHIIPALITPLADLTFKLLDGLHIAQSTNSSHVSLGTSLTSLAISLISGVSQGGGYNVPEETQEDRAPPLTLTGETGRAIKLVRPLRDVGVRECGTYA